ncbi:hypothetical protein LXA43DRAFT_546281 [Ganoderma leucocontextum]|nr:hypothetical protein LXA43DRAFT_546281 [Ganoderma leucocontextum]
MHALVPLRAPPHYGALPHPPDRGIRSCHRPSQRQYLTSLRRHPSLTCRTFVILPRVPRLPSVGPSSRPASRPFRRYFFRQYHPKHPPARCRSRTSLHLTPKPGYVEDRPDPCCQPHRPTVTTPSLQGNFADDPPLYHATRNLRTNLSSIKIKKLNIGACVDIRAVECPLAAGAATHDLVFPLRYTRTRQPFRRVASIVSRKIHQAIAILRSSRRSVSDTCG